MTVPPNLPDACRLVERCSFPDPDGGPVALAVSGGPDSMALMVLARLAGLEGCAIHVDHRLRPGSGSEGTSVAAVAASLGFGFEQRSVTVQPGPDLEARARRARYGVLPRGVLTGHTMDDQAETVLLNALRGAALDGLAGMRPNGAGAGPGTGPAVRRPLLGLRRSETSAVCREAGVEPLDDPTNADPRFRRNRVRHEVIPLLCEVAGRDVVPVLARQAEVLAGDAELLDLLAGQLDPTDARSLAAAPPALARRAVRAWLRGCDPTGERHPPSWAEVNRVIDVARGARRACEVAGGVRVRRSSGRLSLDAPATAGCGGRR